MKSTRYHVGAQTTEQSDHVLFYRSCITNRAVTSILETAHQEIEQIQCEASEYVNRWMKYQFLWDIENQNIEKHIGDDIANWQIFLADVWKRRSVFDTSETRVVFKDVVTIEFGRVQNKVNIKWEQSENKVRTKC